MSNNDSFGDTYLRLGPRKGTTSVSHSLSDTSNIVQMFPYKASDAWVLRKGLECTIFKLISCQRAFDRYVVDKGNGEMGNFVLEDKSDISVLNLHQVGVSHRHASESERSKRGLKGSEIARLS